MAYEDLYLSAKLAHYLSKRGMLEGLINAYKDYRAEQNYPFELKDKRIIKQTLGKIYGEIAGKLSFGGDMEKLKKEFKEIKEFLLEEIEKDVDRVYGEKPKTMSKKLVEEIENKGHKIIKK